MEHARLREPLSGRPLSVLDQCVPLVLRALRAPPPPARAAAAGAPRPTPPTGAAASQLARVRDVTGLCAWLHETHGNRLVKGDRLSVAVLLVGPAASGRTLPTDH